MKYVLRKSGRVRRRWCWGGSTLEPGGPLTLRQASALQWDNSSGWAHLYSLIIGGLKATNKRNWKAKQAKNDLLRVQNVPIFIGPESDHWQCLSLTDSLTHSLRNV